jgi:hypothetical protein
VRGDVDEADEESLDAAVKVRLPLMVGEIGGLLDSVVDIVSEFEVIGDAVTVLDRFGETDELNSEDMLPDVRGERETGSDGDADEE